jgi:phage-related protein
MDAIKLAPDILLPNKNADLASELAGWFSVSGDMDDFIFYDDPDSLAISGR